MSLSDALLPGIDVLNGAEEDLTKAVSTLIGGYIRAMTDASGEGVFRQDEDKLIVWVRAAMKDWHENLKTR